MPRFFNRSKSPRLDASCVEIVLERSNTVMVVDGFREGCRAKLFNTAVPSSPAPITRTELGVDGMVDEFLCLIKNFDYKSKRLYTSTAP